MRCPACESTLVGIIGVDQFFCRECCVEFHVHGQTINIYRPDREGSLDLLSSVTVAREV